MTLFLTLKCVLLKYAVHLLKVGPKGRKKRNIWEEFVRGQWVTM